MILLFIILSIILLRIIWIECNVWKIGCNEKREVCRRANYLLSTIVSPQDLLGKMPQSIGPKFQGEWAVYSCSMTAIALSNISYLYPDYKDTAIKNIDKLINIMLSPELRQYDKDAWMEDPLDSLEGDNDHMSYLSHLVWMMGRYKQISGANKYDDLYHSICEAMNRRMLKNPSLNLLSYPREYVYIPDMLVAIVALHEYSKIFDDRYKPIVNKWMYKAKTEWIDEETGLLVSMLTKSGEILNEVKGSYSALNCYYLSLVDTSFAGKQYKQFKKQFKKNYPLTSIKEYLHNNTSFFTMDIDAGPVIMNTSPSGTAFAIGCATSLGDSRFRKRLLRTAEIVGHSITWNNKTHYLLADIALVGEAITLAMRTSFARV